MRFWDSSAVVPLVFTEPTSGVVRQLLRDDEEMAVWWASTVECVVALNRRFREGSLDSEARKQAGARLELLAGSWWEVQPADRVRYFAKSMSEQHPLKAADTLQLAAAYRWCERETNGRDFLCLDDRLRAAALNEGFTVLPKRSAAQIEAEDSQ